MPQLVDQHVYVFRDSLQLDTIWLDIDGFPARIYNPPDTPEIVFFHVDSAIAHLVSEGKIDTFALHRLERRDTIYQQSIFNTISYRGKSADPLTTSFPGLQTMLSGTILLILFGCFSLLISTAKARLRRYLLSIFDKR